MCTRHKNTIPLYKKNLYSCIFWYLWNILNQIPFDVRKIAIFRNKVLKDMIELKEMFFSKNGSGDGSV